MSYEAVPVLTNREDLDLLIKKLDDKEVDIVLGYVANLLLAGAAVKEERRLTDVERYHRVNPNGPRC